MPNNQSLPPIAAGMPVLGNIRGLAGDVRQFLTSQYQTLGPVFRVKALHLNYTVLAGTEANLFLQREGKNHFRSREFWQDFDAEMGAARSLLSMDGAEHTRYRKVQKRGYSRKVLHDHIAEAVRITEREVAAWPLNEPLPGLYSFQRIITEQLGQLAASTSPRDYLDDMIVFVRTLLLTRATRQRPAALLYTPRFQRARKRIEELYAQVLANHPHDPETAAETPNRDLIDDILGLHHEDAQFLPETDLMVAVMGPFVAGLDTVASTCAFMLYALLTHPELLAQMTEEADAFFADGMPDAKALRKLDVTHRVAMETMRMYPIAPAMTRTVTNSFAFGGYTIPAGEQVLIATTVPHYLPEYFPVPERFDIDRYSAERKEHRQPGVFAPFGLGAHTCLGAGFAEAEIAVTMATIVHNASLVMDPIDYVLKIDPAPTPSPDKHFKFRMTHRR